jgi:RHS repeat-associated protein
MGRRVGKKKNGVLLKQWIYRDALKPVAELDGSGNLVSEFVYGSKSNVPDYVVRGGATYRVISDQLGSPRYVVNVANSGDVPFTATYTSFGVVTGTGLDWMPFGFAGGLYDVDSGLVRFGARDMDPTIGRWVSKDPSLFDGQSPNLYAYAKNDPINWVDPDGQIPLPWPVTAALCAYYEYESANIFQQCAREYQASCGNDPTTDVCADFCGGSPSNPTDDVNKCVQQRDAGDFNAMLKYCAKFATSYMGAGTKATRRVP